MRRQMVTMYINLVSPLQVKISAEEVVKKQKQNDTAHPLVRIG